MVPSPRPLLSRRTVLAGGAGASLFAATGCASTPVTKTSHGLSPDVAIAVEAVAAIREVQDRLTEVEGLRPGLRRATAGLQAVHRAHLAALLGAVPKGVNASPSATSTTMVPATLASIRRAETELHDRLDALALNAASGPFARLLGSMAAAISQQLAVLR